MPSGPHPINLCASVIMLSCAVSQFAAGSRAGGGLVNLFDHHSRRFLPRQRQRLAAKLLLLLPRRRILHALAPILWRWLKAVCKEELCCGLHASADCGVLFKLIPARNASR